MTVSNRAYSLLEIKEMDDSTRTFTGIATTPATDLVDDIVEPKGAQFKLPIPFLWQHDSDRPVGHVTSAKVTSAGIEVKVQLQKTDEPGSVKDRLDTAWQDIKLRLVRGLSIGFKTLESSRIEGTFGSRISKWLWLELSGVTIAANQEASILSIKKFDIGAPAATGHSGSAGDAPPGATGKSTATKPVKLLPKEGTKMKTIAEQISEFEATRQTKWARMESIMATSGEKGLTLDAEQEEEYDGLKAEVKAVDGHIERLRDMEAVQAKAAKPVQTAQTTVAGSDSRGGISVKAQEKLDPGISYARLVKVKMAARLSGDNPLTMAQRMYGADSEVAGIITKANEVVAGTTLSGNWAADLVSAEGAAVAAFLEYLRPATILGKFGVGGIPSLTRLDFYSPYVIETGGGAAYWVGEGKPKPLTAFDYDRSTLTPLKIANIAVLTEENIRYSSPNSDVIVRNALVKAIAAGLDVAFIDPANSGSANVKPASITNGAEAIVSTGDDADDIRLDVRALFQKFIDANNAPQSGVWIMSATNALALSMMVNALGQPEFNGISMMGGTFQGLPVIVSQHIGDVVALVNAADIFLGDEGGIAVDMSREASIEMRSSGLGMDATAGTATVGSVSMFQTNSVALRAERTINWKRGRASAVAYLTSAGWGGAVPAS
jgi:HK97 family phage prohead protease